MTGWRNGNSHAVSSGPHRRLPRANQAPPTRPHGGRRLPLNGRPVGWPEGSNRVRISTRARRFVNLEASEVGWFERRRRRNLQLGALSAQYFCTFFLRLLGLRNFQTRSRVRDAGEFIDIELGCLRCAGARARSGGGAWSGGRHQRRDCCAVLPLRPLPNGRSHICPPARLPADPQSRNQPAAASSAAHTEREATCLARVNSPALWRKDAAASKTCVTGSPGRSPVWPSGLAIGESAPVNLNSLLRAPASIVVAPSSSRLSAWSRVY